jgi:hypothetical protein
VKDEMATEILRLDPKLADSVLACFPERGAWQVKRPRHEPKASWDLEETSGGVYAFLLPVSMLRQRRRMKLHSAKSIGPVALEFCAHPQNIVTVSGKKMSVVYVGRTHRLRRRLRLHFTMARNTSGHPITVAQVRDRLRDSHMARTLSQAVELMREHATIVFYSQELNGVRGVANRDVVETALIGKHMPPFNIKAER